MVISSVPRQGNSVIFEPITEKPHTPETETCLKRNNAVLE